MIISREEKWGEWGKKVQEIRSIIGRHEVDRERLRIVWGMEKSKTVHVRPMDMN